MLVLPGPALLCVTLHHATKVLTRPVSSMTAPPRRAFSITLDGNNTVSPDVLETGSPYLLTHYMETVCFYIVIVTETKHFKNLNSIWGGGNVGMVVENSAHPFMLNLTWSLCGLENPAASLLGWCVHQK